MNLRDHVAASALAGDHAQERVEVEAADIGTLESWHDFQHKHYGSRFSHAHDEFSARRLVLPIVEIET